MLAVTINFRSQHSGLLLKHKTIYQSELMCQRPGLMVFLFHERLLCTVLDGQHQAPVGAAQFKQNKEPSFHLIRFKSVKQFIVKLSLEGNAITKGFVIVFFPFFYRWIRVSGLRLAGNHTKI